MLKITIETSEDDGLIEDIHISFKYVDGVRSISKVNSKPSSQIRGNDTTGTEKKELSLLDKVDEGKFLNNKSQEEEKVVIPVVTDISNREAGQIPAEMLENF